MRRVGCREALVAALSLLECLMLPHSGKSTERIYVLSQAGAALSALDEKAERIDWLLALDKAPAAFTFSSDGRLAYVTHPDLGQVSVVDIGARRVVSRLMVQGSPFGIAVTKDARLFVGDWNGAHVSVLEPEGRITKVVEVGRAPAHLLLSPDERRLFVANRESNSVSVLRTGDLGVDATIPVGRAPFAMALSPDAARLYVGNVQGGDVTIVDAAALEVTATLASGAMPYGAAVLPTGSRMLVTNQQASTVSVLSPAAASPKASIKVGGYPEGVAVSPDGTRAYVANWFSDDISVIDLGSLSELRRIKCPAGPRGISVLQRATP